MTKKDKFLAAAQKFLEKGSLDKALAEFGKAVQEDPKDTRTWLRIAEIHVKRHEHEKATEVYLRTADLYVEQGFFQRAVAVYKNIIKLAPNFIDAHLKLADIYKQLGLMSDAVGQFELASAAYLKAGKSREALNAIRQIVEMNPDQPVPHIKLAEAASQAGVIDEAIREFARAAELLKAQGRVDEYLRVAERLLYHEPQNLALSKEVAARYVERNNARYALAKLQACFQADPRDPETLDLLARAFDQLGQKPKTVSVLKELAKVHGDAGRHGERMQVLQRILQLDPGDADARQAIARPPARPEPPAYVPRGAPPAVPTAIAAPSTFAGAKKRMPAITFSEMQIPNFAQAKEPPAAVSDGADVKNTAERVAIAAGMVDRSDDDANAEAQRIISEADVFVKYGLTERALDHLKRVFDVVPTHVGARERMAAVLLQLGRTGEAVAELETLAEQLAVSKPDEAATHARRALSIDPGTHRAQRVLDGVPADTFSAPNPLSDGPDLIDMDTPKPAPVAASPSPMRGPRVAGFGEATAIVDRRQLGGLAAFEGPTIDEFEGGPVEAVAELEQSGATQVSALTPTPEPITEDDFLSEPLTDGPPQEESFDRIERTHVDAGPQTDPALEADLEQVDFFIEQGLNEEAGGLLDDLEERFPRSPAIAGRRRRVLTASASQGDHGAIPQDTPPVGSGGITPRAMVSAGGTADLSTHGDLGIAYKEMGLFDAAVKEFSILSQDPKREVFALTMMGECFEAKGASAEAVAHYKKALNRPSISEAEATQLYFQLGQLFEQMGERNEALYFYEKVGKREPGFRDVRQRLMELRAQALGARPTAPAPTGDSQESVERAFDSIVTGRKTGR